MKCQLTRLCKWVTKTTEQLKDLPLLFFRLILAYGFWEPALKKWADINAIGEWFASMDFPLPYLNAYLAAGTEMAGVFLYYLVLEPGL